MHETVEPAVVHSLFASG